MSERLGGRLSLRNEREDERLGLSRRSFFFFGSLFLAKPEIVVPEPPLTFTLVDVKTFPCFTPHGYLTEEVCVYLGLRGSDGAYYRQRAYLRHGDPASMLKIGEGDIVKLQQQRGAFRL